MDVLTPETQAPDASGQYSLPSAIQWITVEDAAARLQVAGLPRNNRTIRRYCARGDLDCRKTENALHQPQYFIDAQSVETYIDQQKTLMSSGQDGSGLVQREPDKTGHGLPQSDGRGVDESTVSMHAQAQTGPDAAGPNRMGPGGEFVDQLQARLADKDEEIKFLRSELQHRRTTDTALHDVIAAFRANAESQRLAATPSPEGQGTSQHHGSSQ
jgi:hypothetical protein